MVARTLAAAPVVAAAIVKQLEREGREQGERRGGDSLSASVWEDVWPLWRKEQREFFCFGMDVLLRVGAVLLRVGAVLLRVGAVLLRVGSAVLLRVGAVLLRVAWLSGFQSTMGNSGRSGSPLPPRVAAATAVGASSSDASAVTVATAPEDSDAAATVAVSSDSVSSEADASAALPPSTAAEGLFHTISAPCFSMELHDWLESSGLGSTDLLGSLTRAMDSEPAGEARSSLALLASNLVHSLQLRRIQDEWWELTNRVQSVAAPLLSLLPVCVRGQLPQSPPGLPEALLVACEGCSGQPDLACGEAVWVLGVRYAEWEDEEVGREEAQEGGREGEGEARRGEGAEGRREGERGEGSGAREGGDVENDVDEGRDGGRVDGRDKGWEEGGGLAREEGREGVREKENERDKGGRREEGWEQEGLEERSSGERSEVVEEGRSGGAREEGRSGGSWEDLVVDVQSRVWMTYRWGFPPLPCTAAADGAAGAAGVGGAAAAAGACAGGGGGATGGDATGGGGATGGGATGGGGGATGGGAGRGFTTDTGPCCATAWAASGDDMLAGRSRWGGVGGEGEPSLIAQLFMPDLLARSTCPIYLPDLLARSTCPISTGYKALSLSNANRRVSLLLIPLLTYMAPLVLFPPLPLSSPSNSPPLPSPPSSPPHPLQAYHEVVRLFADSPSPLSPFSLHHLVRGGARLGVKAGAWLGPYRLCVTLGSLVREMEKGGGESGVGEVETGRGEEGEGSERERKNGDGGMVRRAKARRDGEGQEIGEEAGDLSWSEERRLWGKEGPLWGMRVHVVGAHPGGEGGGGAPMLCVDEVMALCGGGGGGGGGEVRKGGGRDAEGGEALEEQWGERDGEREGERGDEERGEASAWRAVLILVPLVLGVDHMDAR
ncbi:unnamed protein product [Closterium sp. NIES-54]